MTPIDSTNDQNNMGRGIYSTLYIGYILLSKYPSKKKT